LRRNHFGVARAASAAAAAHRPNNFSTTATSASKKNFSAAFVRHGTVLPTKTACGGEAKKNRPAAPIGWFDSNASRRTIGLSVFVGVVLMRVDRTDATDAAVAAIAATFRQTPRRTPSAIGARNGKHRT